MDIKYIFIAISLLLIPITSYSEAKAIENEEIIRKVYVVDPDEATLSYKVYDKSFNISSDTKISPSICKEFGGIVVESECIFDKRISHTN